MTTTTLFEKMIDAIGGRDALAGCRAIEFTARETSGSLKGELRSVIGFTPNRYVHFHDYGELRYVNGFDGSLCWNVDYNGKVSILPDPDRVARIIAEENILRGDFLIDPQSYSVEMLESESANEWRVRVRCRAGESTSVGDVVITVDGSTFLIATYDRVRLGTRQITRLSNFRRFDGLLFATLIEELDDDGGIDTLVIDELHVNPDIDPTIFSPPSVDVHDYQFLTGELRTVVPLIHELDHIYTEVVIDGRTYRFMVDTGADATVISTEIVETLRLKPLGTVAINGVNGQQDVDYVRLGELWVGDVMLMNQRIMALDFTSLRRSVTNLDGILGLDFFDRFIVSLDYVRGEMEIIDRSIFRYQGAGQRLALDHNLVEMGFDEFQGKFKVDTGGSCLSVHAPFVRQHDLLRHRADLPCTSTIVGVGETELTICAALCHSLSVGGYTLHDAQVRLVEISTGTFSQQRSIGNAGGEIWSRFKTWFDFSGGAMFIEPNSNFEQVPACSRLGLILKAVSGRYLVDSCLTNSPAAELGVERNDELLEFDGMPAAEIPFDLLRARFRDPAGTSLSMTFRRGDGSINRRSVVLRDFLRHYDCSLPATPAVTPDLL